MTLKATQNRAAAGEIPTFTIGRTVCALRSKLDAHLQGLAARAEAERASEVRAADAVASSPAAVEDTRRRR